MYIKIDNNTWVEYLDDKSKVIKKDEIEAELQSLESEICNFPKIDDKFLLKWAKTNYQFTKSIEIKESFDRDIQKRKEILTNLV